LKTIVITGGTRGIGRATTLRGDVAIETDVVSLFDDVESKLGRPDGVVINAGIVAPSLPLADMDSARLKRMFEVNVYGAYLCARESARRLSKGAAPIPACTLAASNALRSSGDRIRRMPSTTIGSVIKIATIRRSRKIYSQPWSTSRIGQLRQTNNWARNCSDMPNAMAVENPNTRAARAT
jgi:NAD(P)-dependent dehydrogenase (short-subunit alcohol dehydrogenase family)